MMKMMMNVTMLMKLTTLLILALKLNFGEFCVFVYDAFIESKYFISTTYNNNKFFRFFCMYLFTIDEIWGGVQ